MTFSTRWISSRIRGRNYLLFGVLLGLITFLLLPESMLERRIARAVFSGCFVACLYAISTNRQVFLIASILLIPSLIGSWVNEIAQVKFLSVFTFATQAIFLIYAAVLVLKVVLFARHQVALDTIMGAINVYLLIGVIWAYFYFIALLLEPSAFRFSGEVNAVVSMDPVASHASHLAYYSFVTLSTLGYGDVTASAPITRLLAVFEALTGQLYLVTLVAGLVGRRSERKRTDSGLA